MNISNKFLEDEVRNGFYVPSIMKQAWAAELEMLSDFDQLCKDNSITYFADFGTLLGAVRHNGFIPWDDDIDITMTRNNYNKLLKVVDKLPANYSLHTFRNEDGFREFHSVLVNTEHPQFTEEHYNKYHGFFYTCGIDIYILDNISSEPSVEKKRRDDIMFLLAFADGMLENRYSKEVVTSNLCSIEKSFNISLDKSSDSKSIWIQIYDLIEQICSGKYIDYPTDSITCVIPNLVTNRMDQAFNPKDFEEIVYWDFEHIQLPIPANYSSILTQEYGDYMTIVKNTMAHNYPYFDKQKKALEEAADFSLNMYTFKKYINQKANDSNTDESWKTIVSECLDNLKLLLSQIITNPLKSENLIADTQDLCIELGTLIETVKGEGHKTVKIIEKHCENLYILYQKLSNPPIDLSDVTNSFVMLCESIDNDILNKKEVVFIPFNGKYWDSLQKTYFNYKNNPEYDVYVMPVPYFYKNYDGSLYDIQYDISTYPSDISLVDYQSFQLEFRKPDVIVIQNPYDQFNYSTSVHPDFYSSVLKQYTRQLIYIPWFQTDSFTKDDYCSYINMDYYVTMPGVANSDLVLLQDDCLKNTYIDKLTDWSSDSYRDKWINLIQIQS